MSTPTLYRWDDPGAPQIINQQPSEFFNVLKKCLVEGYGDKTPLGWSLAFEDAVNMKIVFQNSTVNGSGYFIRFNTALGDDSTSGGNYIFLKGAQGASDIDTLTNPTNQFAFYNVIEYINGAEPAHWVLVGTDTAFYVLIPNKRWQSLMQQYTSATVSFFAGDIIPTLENDQGRGTVIQSSDANQTSGSWTQSLHYSLYPTESGATDFYDADGTTDKGEYELWNVFDVTDLYVDGDDSVLPNLYSKSYIRSPAITTYDRDGIRVFHSLTRPYIRGHLPGLIVNAYPTNNASAWPYIKQIEGVNHLSVLSYAPGVRAWINLGSWL